MPGYNHETVTSTFRAFIDRQIIIMGLFDDVVFRGSPLTSLGDWNKEPGASWAPRKSDNLSVVLEVGSSESANKLATDAKGWLETPGATVEVCLTIDIRNDTELVIDVWRLGARTDGVLSRPSPFQAVREQHLVIVNNGEETEVHGWRLLYNVEKIFNDELRLESDVFIGRLTPAPHQAILLVTVSAVH